MKSLKEILPLLDRWTVSVLEVKTLSKGEFIEKFGDEKLYNYIHNSKCGLIEVTHKIRGDKHHGFTAAFGEGIGCRMSNESNWFTTSIIKNIDWDKKEFETLNSVYTFEFTEIEWNKLFNEIRNATNESKNKETE